MQQNHYNHSYHWTQRSRWFGVLTTFDNTSLRSADLSAIFLIRDQKTLLLLQTKSECGYKSKDRFHNVHANNIIAKTGHAKFKRFYYDSIFLVNSDYINIMLTDSFSDSSVCEFGQNKYSSMIVLTFRPSKGLNNHTLNVFLLGQNFRMFLRHNS